MRSVAFEHDQCACETLARIADFLPMAVWITAPDGRLEYANRAARELPAEVLEFASFTNGERMRFLRAGGFEVMVLRQNGERCCVAASRPVVSAPLLRALYALTPAETRVAASLAAGRTARRAAEEASVSLNTVRTQIKSLFVKTGTSSQNELVALLAGGIVACRIDEKTFTQLRDSAIQEER